jgi:NAD(P)-dependent dehydrogenase (short-subunit alcohol dehydrogenase family)
MLLPATWRLWSQLSCSIRCGSFHCSWTLRTGKRHTLLLRQPRTSLLINDAGVLASGSLLASDIEALRQDIDTNYLGTLNVIRSFAPVIERQGGRAIVNVLTLIALASMPGFGGYSASKAAAYSMTQAVRAELGAKGIRVHAVFPGAVDTDMLRSVEMSKTSPQEIARAVLAAVEAGEEDIFPDPMSQQGHATWRYDPKALERQFGGM